MLFHSIQRTVLSIAQLARTNLEGDSQYSLSTFLSIETEIIFSQSNTMCIFGVSEKPSLAQDINANFIIIFFSTTSGDIYKTTQWSG